METEPQTKNESELPVFISFSNYGYIKMAENLLRNMKEILTITAHLVKALNCHFLFSSFFRAR